MITEPSADRLVAQRTSLNGASTGFRAVSYSLLPVMPERAIRAPDDGGWRRRRGDDVCGTAAG